MEYLYMIVYGDIYNHYYDEISNIFKNYTRDSIRKSKCLRGFVAQPSKAIVGLIKMDIGNLLEDINTDILHSLEM